MNLDSNLNENQRAAVEWTEGPLLVLAGPGSGKTRVLTYHIAHLLEMSPDDSFKILGLTFTNKAAQEMRTRIENLVSNERALLTTIHTFCANILRQHGHHIGLSPNFTILSQETDRIAVLHEAIRQMDPNNSENDSTPTRFMPVIEQLLMNCVAIEEAEQFLSKENVKYPDKMAAIYRHYRLHLKEINCLDFASLLIETFELLKTKAAIRKLIQRIYTHICVDEFQDTNKAQYEILKQLVNPELQNLFIVADDDQIIYQWNGASPERLKDLSNDFQITEFQLPENYRCPIEVIEITNRLIINNPSHSKNKQNLSSAKSPKSALRLKHFSNFDKESNWIAEDIASRPKTEQTQTVVLARTRKLLEKIVLSLQRNKLDGYISIRKDDFYSAPMQWLQAILSLANSRQDRIQLARICNTFQQFTDISLNIDDIILNANITENDYLRTWRENVLRDSEKLTPECLKIIKDDILELLDYMNFSNFLENTFKWFDNHPIVSYPEYKEEQLVWNNIYDNIKSNYENKFSLHALLQDLNLHSKTPEPTKNAIRCYTIHQAKGLEFKHVYLMGLVEEQLPNYFACQKNDNSHEIQEERRSCFVAITRAEISLTLSYADQYFGHSKKPSRFLKEMGLINT